MKKLEFPNGFLWGAASASHQNEGNNSNNDFWAWERIPGHIVDGSVSGAACDWWRRAEEDFERAQSLNLKTIRLSVEWSRLEPEKGRWDDGAMNRYRQMLKDLQNRGITPMITLHHFSNPLWLADMGGWLNRETISLFARFVKKTVESLQDLCSLWATINEPNVYAAMAYALGKWPPGENNPVHSMIVMKRMVWAHAAAYREIKRIDPQAHVGLVQHMARFDPVNRGSLPNRLVAELRSKLINWRILEAVNHGCLKFPLGTGVFHPALARTGDYIGLNYYGRHMIKFNPLALGGLCAEEAPGDPEIAWPEPWIDREIDPYGLYKFIMETHKRFGKPIYITENGMADSTDKIRPGFILTHLSAVHKAVKDGADVRGFYYWTFVDNYEWVEGWTTRFGLIGLNPETQERTIRKSAQLYGEIAAANAITEEIVEKYAPELKDQIIG